MFFVIFISPTQYCVGNQYKLIHVNTNKIDKPRNLYKTNENKDEPNIV
jgi:hypothetical protein